MLRLGVLGGMMDPIHRGHLEAARAALAAGLDRVLLVPCQTPAHRSPACAPPADRLAMCALAAEGDAALEASDIEMREGTCYAVDTVRLLLARCPDARVTWIVGADKLPSLSGWHDAQSLFSLCDFMVCPRPGADAHLPVSGARLRVLDAPALPASSGQAVEEIGRFSDALELLPRAVSRYIALHGLYHMDYEAALRRYGVTEARLRHTLGVRKTAVALAERWGAGMQAAAAAAMLHDLVKSLPFERMQALAGEYLPGCDGQTLADANLLHGPLAAAVAEKELGVTDARVLSAIACHTTGKRGMSTLDQVLYLADAIEPGRRPYPALAEIRRLATENLRAATLLCMRRTSEYVLSQGKRLCPQTGQAIAELARLEKGDAS